MANANSVRYCKHCNNEIPKDKPIGAKYCSRNCYFDNKDSYRKTNLKGICLHCGSEFVVDSRYRYLLKTKKFCSHECSELFYSGKNHHKYVEKTKLRCKICNSEFEVIPYLSDKIKTCRNPDCYKKWMSLTFSGENHPLWKGGLSFEPYCPKFNETFKERVRAFFGYRCVVCNKEQTSQKLSVHHVHYEKEACCDQTIPKMFVPLCRSCHTKTNHDRNLWREYFEQIIISKFDGRSYYTIDEWKKIKS